MADDGSVTRARVPAGAYGGQAAQLPGLLGVVGNSEVEQRYARQQYEAFLDAQRMEFALASRTSLASALLQCVAGAVAHDKWPEAAEKALAAAKIIYPDPGEAE